MKALIGGLIGLAVSVSASAELLLEGRVRLESGEPVADAQVKLFDMADLQRGAVVRATTDGTGYFALPFAALTGSALPKSFTLGQNYPNPFNPSTIIPYQLATSSPVRLAVFNLLGQRVVTLVDGERPAGFHTASWDATDAAGRAVGAGIYIYRMTVGMEHQSGRMVLIDGQAGVAAAGAASGLSGASAGDGSAGEESEVYGLSVSGSGLTPYMDPEFRVRSGMAPVELVVSAALQPASKAADPDALVEIPDANLRRALEAYLGKEIDAPITVADMEVLTDLDAKLASIIDLTGLEFATNLTLLFLDGNAIADVSPLANLTNLTLLGLGDNVADVSPLANLTNLTYLSLSNNSITDVSPLAGLTNLKHLFLGNNSITDVSPLANLTNLITLYLEGNAIEDVSPLAGLTNLRFLYLGHNAIADVSPLANLTNLSTLYLWHNAITDVSPLANLTLLTTLYLQGNAITDVSPLANLTNLSTLLLEGNAITDVSPLAGLTNLEWQDFVLEEEGTGEPVTIPDANLRAAIAAALGKESYAPITVADMETLTGLYAQEVDISDLTGLEFAANLTWLELQGNAIVDVSPLSGLTNLTHLFLDNNSITDVSPLSGLTNLIELKLQNNSITDFSPLSGLTNLEKLDFVLEKEVTIPDANLRRLIAAALDKEIDAPISVEEMKALNKLGARNANISDLTGLEFATNLTYLYLAGNAISDVSPLAGLTLRLDWLDLDNNSITDVSPLSGLTNLTHLFLDNNSITDVSPLSGLTNLRGLILSRNRIADVSPLSGLTNLRGLILSRNRIADVSPLSGLTNLTHLSLDNNSITDVSPLSNLTNLIRLILSGNAITDVSPLSGLTSLEELGLQGNAIADMSPLSGLSNLTYLHYDDTLIPDAHLRRAIAAALGKESDAPISVADMETLTKLHAYEKGISDLTGLELATNLIELELVRNAIVDVSPLANLTNLTVLDLRANAIADVSPLSGLTNLTRLYLHHNSITDVSPLAGLTNLTWLSLEANRLTDVSPLSGLTNLTRLFLDNNGITDVSPLAGLTNLTYLILDNNSITNVSLSGLTNLTRLDLQYNSITDVSLSGLTNLTELELHNNAITDMSLTDLPSLRKLRVWNNAIADVSLADLSSLTDVSFRNNRLTDVSLSDLPKLTWLELQDNAITDMSLSGLPRLEWLYLQNNKLTDASSLADLPRLRELMIWNNAIADVWPLAGLTSLEELDIRSNAIVDVSPLVDLPNLTVLALQGNPLNVTSIDNHIAALESRGIEVSFYSSRQSRGDFNIELVFLDNFLDHFTGSQQGEFEQAARRWMSIITEDLPDYEFTQGWSGTCGDESFEIPPGERIDDLRIYVSLLDDDDPAAGRGGPMLLRETYLPVVGCMRFKSGVSSIYLGSHEIVHVLGFDKWVWESFGFLHGLDSDPHFNGPLAVAAFDAAGGWDYAGPGVPVEEDDFFSHWRKSVFGDEIMQAGDGWKLSAITIQALADLGYSVDVTQADPYTLPSAASAKVAATHAEWEHGVGDSQEREPIYVVDQQGYIIRTLGD